MTSPENNVTDIDDLFKDQEQITVTIEVTMKTKVTSKRTVNREELEAILDNEDEDLSQMFEDVEFDPDDREFEFTVFDVSGKTIE